MFSGNFSHLSTFYVLCGVGVESKKRERRRKVVELADVLLLFTFLPSYVI